MPCYDLTCPSGHEQIDVFLRLGERPPCPTCGAATSTLWRQTSNVIQDSIEGGVLIRHGLTGPNGEPVRYYSKKEMAVEAKRRGLVQGGDSSVPYKPPTRPMRFFT